MTVRYFSLLMFLFTVICSLNAQNVKNTKSKDVVVTPEGEKPDKNLVESFDFNNVDIMTLVKQISRLTGKRFIVDETIASKKKGITIVAPTSISVQEAYDTFLTVLDAHGLAVVKSGPMLKIVDKNTSSSGVSLYKGEYFPRNDEYITKLIKLDHINASDLANTLSGTAVGAKPGTGLIASTVKLKALDDTNTLIVTGTGSQISDIVEMVKILDIKDDASKLAVIPVNNADAGHLKNIVEQILFNQGSSSVASTGVPTRRTPARFPATTGTTSSGVITRGAERYSTIYVDDRTNSIIVLANNAGINSVRELVRKLDFKMEGSNGIHIYSLSNARADKLSETLNRIIGTTSGSATTASTQSTGTVASGMFEGVKITHDGGSVSGAGTSGTASSGGGGTNSLIIIAKPKQYEELKPIIASLDKRKGQVLFETITMELSLGDDTSFGISSNYALSSEVPRAVGFDPGVSSSNNIMNFLTNPSALSGMILGFGSKKTVSVTMGGTSMKIPTLSAFITALEKNSEANVLQRPSIITSDNETAVIEVMDKIPNVKGTVVQQGISQQNIEMIDVGLKLEITPTINDNSDFIKLKIKQETSNITDKAPRDLAGTTTATNKRSIDTNVIVRDKDTVVIGGLYRDDLSVTYNKVPILGDIPLLGWFFKGKTTRATKTNLVVFITPNIVRDYETHSKLTLQNLEGRKGFVKTNFTSADKFGAISASVEEKVRSQMSDKDLEEFDKSKYMPEDGVKPIGLQ